MPVRQVGRSAPAARSSVRPSAGTAPTRTARDRRRGERSRAGVSRRRSGCLGWTIVVVLAVIVTLVVVFAWIVPSQRKWYAIDEVRIEDRVLRNGTLTTVERFTYTFHGHYTRVYRDIPWDGHAIVVTGVTGPDGRPLTRLPSAWTPASGPPREARPGADPTPSPWTSIPPEQRPAGYYRVSQASADWLGTVTRIEAFADLDDTTADFTFRWRAPEAAERWQDAGELEWQLVGRAWEVPIGKVRAVVSLPPGAGRSDVLAWGHGPLNGVLRILADGAVTLAVDDLPPRTYVELHELFPARLLSRVDQIPIEVTDSVVETEARVRGAGQRGAGRGARRARAQGAQQAPGPDRHRSRRARRARRVAGRLRPQWTRVPAAVPAAVPQGGARRPAAGARRPALAHGTQSHRRRPHGDPAGPGREGGRAHHLRAGHGVARQEEHRPAGRPGCAAHAPGRERGQGRRAHRAARGPPLRRRGREGLPDGARAAVVGEAAQDEVQDRDGALARRRGEARRGARVPREGAAAGTWRRPPSPQ